MKISYRLIIITFAVVLLITVTTNLIYYSTTNNILKKQQESNLNVAVNKLQFFYKSFNDSLKNEFNNFLTSKKSLRNFDVENSILDFIIVSKEDNSTSPIIYTAKDKVAGRFNTNIEIRNLFENSPDLISLYYTHEQNLYLYGKVINNDFLDRISESIQADIVCYNKDSVIAVSNKNFNFTLLDEINKNIFSDKEKSWRENESEILISKIENISIQENNSSKFALFINSKELSEFRFFSTSLLIILVVTGILLSLIFILLFTSKLRTQISFLYKSAEEAAKGNLETRVKIISKDELGKLGLAFNNMLSELKRKHDDEREYTELLSLINQNPSLEKISEAVLLKILNHTKIRFGAIYLIDENKLRILSSAGLNLPKNEIELSGNYKNCYDSKNYSEIFYREEKPKINFGFSEISIEYQLVYPIIYNNSIISLIEIVSESKPSINIAKYLEKLHDQLALGIVNSSAFERLSVLVEQLKELNITYENQNRQIKEQNSRLLELHKELKIKAYELEKEKKNAEELTKVKSQFLAGMSHELKTPLTAILTLTELVKRNLSQEEDAERLSVVSRNGKKLLSLINNILEFSKIESGKIEIKAEKFLVSEIVNENIEQIKSLINDKPIAIKVNLEKEYEVLTDKIKFEQIINNLLSNSAKYTNAGEIRINVTSTHDKILRIEVADTGIGISESDQQIIFEEFKQLNSNSKMKNKGSGLGLSICKKYVDLLNGFITLRSQLNLGTSITISIPNIIVSENKNESAETLSAVSSEMNILIVDDDDDTLYSISEIIRTMGFQFKTAKNGVECLSLLESSYKPDLILLDIMMPIKNGFDTIKDIRSNPNYKSLIVYAVTAHAMLENKEVVERNGFDGIITKPIINEDLEDVLIKIFQSK